MEGKPAGGSGGMIPLVVHSHYSLMRGVNPVEKICRLAASHGYRRLALTDTDNLYGLWPFLKACKQENISPIIGAVVTEPGSKRQAVCLVESGLGYSNLCRLLTSRLCNEGFDLQEAVAAHATGFVVLTNDSGLLRGLREREVAVAAALPSRPDGAAHRLRREAEYLAVPVAATPESFFLQVEEYKIHRVLRAIDLNTSLSRLRADDLVSPESWLAPAATYKRRFAIWPEAVRHTHAIAERCSFAGPDFGVVLPPYEGLAQGRPGQLLRKAAYEGARGRYGVDLSAAVVERLEHELRIIEAKCFSSYFLVVRDIVRTSSLICGRGSGAASLVAYCLGITNVCPLKYGLYFERFLNPDRRDPPDIDIDFAWDERDEILREVLVKHRGHAALVCNHVLFQPRMAIREVAKVHGLTEREIGRITGRLPWSGHGVSGPDFSGWIKKMPEFKGVDFAPPWPEILQLAQQLIGIPRNLSVHPGGVVITPRPLAEYVPIERAPKGVPIIQWEKDGAEEAGLVKIDLLGNRSLGVIRDTIRSVRQNGAIFDERDWEPEEDEPTRRTISEGRTMGCFYVESPAMRLLEQKAGTGDFEQLVLQSSIIRPAANDCIKEYLRRLHGGNWQPLHPLLKDVLDETYGIMVYQEDVSRAAVALAGFSHAQADGLRKILSKKDKESRLRDYRALFRAGAGKRGVPVKEQEAIWRMMMSFDGYSFCKPHSASYARVSFQAAFLKTHYPAEFMAAVISNQGGYYSTFAYVSEARRLGLKILPPDVNQSEDYWTGKDSALRVGLMAIKDLAAVTRTRIIAGRTRAAYRSIADFFQRVRPADDEARALIHAGALDCLNPARERPALLWYLACWQKAQLSPSARTLFSCIKDVSPPKLPAQGKKERYRREYEALGFLCDRHPLTLCVSGLGDAGRVKAADFHRCRGKRVRFAGWLITGKLVRSKKGEPMEFLTFEDETGLAESTFFPETYRRFCHLLENNRPYLLTGLVEEDYGAVTLTVERVRRL